MRIRELSGSVVTGRDARGLSREELHELYRALCLTRAAEERLEVLHEQGHLTGDLYRSLGQEAGAVGAAFALRRTNDGTGDFLAPTVRAAGALFLFGAEVVDFFRQYMARGTGPTKGREANVHWVDFQKGFVGPVSPLGTMIEVMAGITLSFRVRGQDRVGMVFCGAGASSTGAWHEGLNFAAVQQCPMILVVENNQWALATSTHRNTRVENFTAQGPGYGIEAESVDGTDVLAVFDAVRRAAAVARSGDGVSLLELRYFRLGADAQHDLQDYADPVMIAESEEKDPIGGFRGRMLENGWATEEELTTIESEEFERCRVASEQAIEESLPDGPDAVESVYSNLDATRPWTRAVSPDPTIA